MKILNISLDDLPENQRDIAEAIGIDAFVQLSKTCGGDEPYIMLYSELERIALNKRLIHEFNGSNYKELALKYGYSVKTIYRKIPRELRKGGVNCD